MTDEITTPVIISDGQSQTISTPIQALVGQPAVDISGDQATLRVLQNGSISAPDAGNTAVQSSGNNVAIRNLGAISGDFNGISATGNDFTLSNRGAIQSNSRAVDLSDGDRLSIRNSGSILGTGNQRNGTLYVDGTVDNARISNSGLIDAGEGNLGDAVSVQVGAAGDPSNEDINIQNSGVLQGRGDGPEVFADGVRVAANGSSGLRFFNGSGEDEATISGTINNRGRITSEVNVGFLGGVVVEDGVAFDGRINNNGLIDGPRNGLYIGDAEHNLTINNGGRIESGSRAVNLDGDNVTLNNRGSILGTGDQRNGTLYLDGTADNTTVNNTGLIDAGEGNSGSGVSVQVGTANGLGEGVDDVELSASINNRGVIQGRGDGNVPVGVRLFLGSGLSEASFTGNIANAGTIASEQQAGILIESGIVFDGQIINRGAISGGNGLAIDADGALGSVNVLNRGALNGDVRLGTGDDVFVQSTHDDVVVTGGIGSDRITGGRGTDTVRYDDLDVGVAVDLAAGTAERSTGFDLAINDLTLVNPNDGIAASEILSEGIAGNLYFNFHTADFPSGELRGQLALASDNRDANGVGTVDFTANISGDQEVPTPADTDASGAATVTFTAGADGSLTYSTNVSITGLNQADLLPVNIGNGTLSPIHLHNAPAGVNGPVVVDIASDAGPSGLVPISELDTLSSIENVVGSNDADLIVGNANANVLEGLEGDDNLQGLGGQDDLSGGLGSDLLSGGSGDDLLSGGLDADTFVFELGGGRDTISDFSVSEDRLDVSAFFTTAENALGSARQTGSDTLIEFDTDSSVLLSSVDLNTLSSDNFTFA